MFKEFKLNTFSDERGKLTPLNISEMNLFEVKRIYAVYENKMKRGGHAHFREEELFFMSSGSCVCRLHDGHEWEEIVLEAVGNAVYVGNMIWHEFERFSEGAVLIALSSTEYNPARMDYEENFEEFVKSFE